LHYEDSESKRLRWVEHVVRMGERRNAHKITIGKLGEPVFGIPRRWRNEIYMDLRVN
jgi:hypothetical protein